MKNLFRSFLALFLLFGALCCAPILAQSTSGVVTGQVTDATGAAVPSADVQLTNINTGASRTTKTNGSGEYSLEEVPNGNYRVQVTSPSFRSSVINNVTVNVATTTRVDAKLAVGTSGEVVEVYADAIQVNTENGALGSVVDGQQVKELPLNGRSFVELTQLAPGVSGANNFDSKNKGLLGGVDFSVNGNPTTNNLFLVDGANDNDVGSNRTILIYPSIEAIAEFKMQTNSYGPEYGQASGAVISIVTRAGVNKFHGSVFYSGRNDALTSYTYFSRRNAGLGQPHDGKDKLRRNDYGYSIGGPIKKDKLFFFFNQEFTSDIKGYTVASCVPTAAERAGDFTTTSCGGAPTIPLNLQKPGNPLALKSVDPAGVLLAAYLPLPNKTVAAGADNYSLSLPSKTTYRQENGRIDFNLNSKNLIMGRYTQDSFTAPAYNGNQFWGDSAFPVINANWAQPSKQAILRWTSTVSSTLVNDAEFAYSNNRINITPGGSNPGLVAQLAAAIPTLYPSSLKVAPQSTPTVWGGLGAYGDYGTNIWSIAPWNNSLDIYTFRDDVSKVAGRHVLKVGGFYGKDSKDEDNSAASTEHPTFLTYDFNVDTNNGGVATGNNLANALIPKNPFILAETSTNVKTKLRWTDLEFYAGDTYKVTPRLTLSYGLRYSLLFNPVSPDNHFTNFQASLYDPGKPASDGCNGLLIVPGTNPCGDANKQFGTTFSSGTPGVNRSLIANNHHLVAPRLGIAYDVFGNGRTALRAGFGQFYQRERVAIYKGANANSPFVLNTSNYSRALGGATPTNLSSSSSPSSGFDTAGVLPASFQWNLTLEQELHKNITVQISYVGDRGTHLTSSYDVNAVRPANYAAATFNPGGATNALRPYSNFGSIGYFSHNGDSYYEGLQTALKAQIKSVKIGIAYTFSHSIADVATDDSSGGTGAQSFTYAPNPGLDRGNSATNRPNIFVANATYFFPKLDGSNFATRTALGGWELTAITQAESGNSFTIFQNNAGQVSALFGSGLTGNQRPVLAPGQSCNSGGIKGEQIYNPKAFTLNGYHLGTLDPLMSHRGQCEGPRLVNTDLSLDKNFKVTERFRLQFRLDAFDLFNHANFRGDVGNINNPVTQVACGANPCSATNNVVTSSTLNGGFGKSQALVGNSQRQIQYGLHLEF